MKSICVITALIVWTIGLSSNGFCQTARTDSSKVPNFLIDDCIHYKADAEFYQYVADSTSFKIVELKEENKEIKRDLWYYLGISYLCGLGTVIILMTVR